MAHSQCNGGISPQFSALYSERFIHLVSNLAGSLSPEDCSVAIETAMELQRRMLPESLMCVSAAAVGIAASMDFIPAELDPEEKRLAREAAAVFDNPEATMPVITRQLADCVAAICTVRLRSFVERSIQNGRSQIPLEKPCVADFIAPFCALRNRLKVSILFPQFDHYLRQTLDILELEPAWLADERRAYRFRMATETPSNVLTVVQKLMDAAGLFVCRQSEDSDLYVSSFRNDAAWLSRVVTALAARLSEVKVTPIGFNDLPEGAQWTRRTLTIDQKGMIYRRQAMMKCHQMDPIPTLLKLADLAL